MSISPRVARRLLWLAMAFTVPVPFYLGGLEFAPVVRLLFLCCLVWGILLTEGVGGFQGALSVLAGVQLVVWAGLFWGTAALLAHASRRLADSRRALVFGAMIATLLVVSLADVYHTPLSSRRIRSNLFGLFD